MTPELQSIVERLEKIEKQIADLTLVPTDARPGRTIVAQNFLVADTQGVRRAELGMVVPVGQTEERPWLGLFDENENIRICLGAGLGQDKDKPWLELYGPNQNVAVEVTAGENGPAVRLFDANGKPGVVASASKWGPMVAISNPNGKQTLNLSIFPSGEPWLVMEDANGDKVLKLAVDGNRPCLLFGKDNKVFWSAP